MYCSNCGKPVKEKDNFCRYCGNNLRAQDDEFAIQTATEEVVNESNDDNLITEEKILDEPFYDGEELVLYDFKKHWMALFWSAFLTPVFFIYFWTIFLNTHSFFSWIVVAGFLVLIIYPVARYKSDKFIVTTKSIHIKIGVLNPAKFEIPLNNLNIIDISQSSMGRILDYGTASVCINSEKYDYTYIKEPEDLQYILNEPAMFIKEALEE